jgi:hypothetical protein
MIKICPSLIKLIQETMRCCTKLYVVGESSLHVAVSFICSFCFTVGVSVPLKMGGTRTSATFELHDCFQGSCHFYHLILKLILHVRCVFP